MALSRLPVILLALSSIPTSSAQSNSTVWGTVVILNHGERTPSLASDHYPILTPLGADQMLSQGQAFRARYINSTEAEESNITESHPIRDLERDALDNAQLILMSTIDDYVVAGAQAFMQGLYPPNSDAFLDSFGGEDGLSWDNLRDENVQYPLDGFQYPSIQSRSTLDETSLPLQGHSGCMAWLASISQVDTDPEMQRAHDDSQDSIEEFFSKPPFSGTVSNETVNFFNSYQLWDFARYQIAHNRSAYEDELHPDRERTALESLKRNALKAQQAVHTDVEVSRLESEANRANNRVRTIAGRTLAHGILTSLESILLARGRSSSAAPKLSVMFTSFEPLLSFYSLAGLRTSDTDSNSDFYGLPDPAAAVALEIVGDSSGDGIPNEEDLFVRFAYRANSEPETPFRTQTLFGASKNEWRMPLARFKTKMGTIALNVDDWCKLCGSTHQLYCLARELIENGDLGAGGSADGDGSSSSRGGVRDPVVAGVIGAVTALAFAALLCAAACVLGGVRVYRKRKDNDDQNGQGRGARRVFGGFKGAEKMASDADLTLTKGGARHERVGSWELRGADGQGDVGGGGLRVDGKDVERGHVPNTGENRNTNDGQEGANIVYDKSMGLDRRRREEVDEDGVSVMSTDIGTLPVRPRESL